MEVKKILLNIKVAWGLQPWNELFYFVQIPNTSGMFSNWNCQGLRDLLSFARIKPAVLQVKKVAQKKDTF